MSDKVTTNEYLARLLRRELEVKKVAKHPYSEIDIDTKVISEPSIEPKEDK